MMKTLRNIIIGLLASCSLPAAYASDVSNLEDVLFSKISPVDSSLWIATGDRGLIRVGRNHKLFSYSAAQGDFPCDTIVAMEFDGGGVLWLLDSRGDTYSYSSFQGFAVTQAPEHIAKCLAAPVHEEEAPIDETVQQAEETKKLPSRRFRWWYILLGLLCFWLGNLLNRQSGDERKRVVEEIRPEPVKPSAPPKPSAQSKPSAPAKAAELNKAPKTGVTKHNVTKSDTQSFYNEVVALVDKNYSNPSFSVEDIAAHFGISRVHLNRKLKGISEKSPSELIKSARMKLALELLESGNYSMVEIAQKCGFSSPAYFSTAFKEFYGKSPSAYLMS